MRRILYFSTSFARRQPLCKLKLNATGTAIMSMILLALLCVVSTSSAESTNTLRGRQQNGRQKRGGISDTMGVRTWYARAMLVREAVKDSWSEYRAHAFFNDDLRPNSQEGFDWMHSRATLYDSLDTLYIVGLREEFDSAVVEAIGQWWKPGLGVSTSAVFPAKVFEYHIRVVGGLLGAFSVSGRRELLHAAVLAAECVLNALGPLDSDVPLPRKHARIVHPTTMPIVSLFASIFDSLRATYDPTVWCNTLAGLGSFGLELRVLSRETGDPRFRDAAEKIHAEINRRRLRSKQSAQEKRNASLGEGPSARHIRKNIERSNSENGFLHMKYFIPPKKPLLSWLLPTACWLGRTMGFLSQDAYEYTLNTSKFRDEKCSQMHKIVGFGSGGDSYYEYLLKESLVEVEPSSRARLMMSYKAMLATALGDQSPVLAGRLQVGSRTENGHDSSTIRDPDDLPQVTVVTYGGHNTHQHLSCFAGGMFALGSVAFKNTAPANMRLSLTDAESATSMTAAKSITEQCVRTYTVNPSGLAGDISDVNPRTGVILGTRVKTYKLRPETIESLMVLFRTTGDEKYRQMGWDIFKAMLRHCRVTEFGTNSYSGILDVTGKAGNLKQNDYMPSYFMAETLKYLYLLFAFDANGIPESPPTQLRQRQSAHALPQILATSALPLDKWVFNTEAHPFSIRQRCEMKSFEAPPCSGPKHPPMLMPWDAILLFLSGMVLIYMCCFTRCHAECCCCCCCCCCNLPVAVTPWSSYINIDMATLTHSKRH